jgi:transposase-like protein
MVHKTANVLDSLPKSVHSRAKAAIREITRAEGKGEAERAVEAFAKEFGVKWPKAVSKITSEREALLAFYDYPAEHWIHLRTSNPIENRHTQYGHRSPACSSSSFAGLAGLWFPGIHFWRA